MLLFDNLNLNRNNPCDMTSYPELLKSLISHIIRCSNRSPCEIEKYELEFKYEPSKFNMLSHIFNMWIELFQMGCEITIKLQHCLLAIQMFKFVFRLEYLKQKFFL